MGMPGRPRGATLPGWVSLVLRFVFKIFFVVLFFFSSFYSFRRYPRAAADCLALQKPFLHTQLWHRGRRSPAARSAVTAQRPTRVRFTFRLFPVSESSSFPLISQAPENTFFLPKKFPLARKQKQTNNTENGSDAAAPLSMNASG